MANLDKIGSLIYIDCSNMSVLSWTFLLQFLRISTSQFYPLYIYNVCTAKTNLPQLTTCNKWNQVDYLHAWQHICTKMRQLKLHTNFMMKFAVAWEQCKETQKCITDTFIQPRRRNDSMLRISTAIAWFLSVSLNIFQSAGDSATTAHTFSETIPFDSYRNGENHSM